MSTRIGDIEDTLERHRTRLEASLQKLRKALHQWQTYSAEYEGLKEELQSLEKSASRSDMIAAGEALGGTVVDSAEVLALLGDKAGIRRTRDQVTEAIDHRITYVTENIERVEKQLRTGEDKLAGLLVVQGPEVTTEDGEPIVEICEELDEDGNIISSSMKPHGAGPAQRMNLDDLNDFKKYIEEASKETQSIQMPLQNNQQDTARIPEPQMYINQEDLEDDLLQSHGGDQGESGVPVHEIHLEEIAEEEEKTENRVSPVRKVQEATFDISTLPQTADILESKAVLSPNFRPTDGHTIPQEVPFKEEDFVLSVDEPPDAADLRRQMIDYNLHNIGAVVAEIDLEDDYDEDEDDDYEDDDEEEDEDEDDYGRSTRRVITADIHREMQELQARIRERQAQEQAAKKTHQSPHQQQQPKIELHNAAQVRIEQEKPAKKKGVKFSDKLDVKTIPPKEPAKQYVLPPSPTLDGDDAVPFLVDLLAREQMKEDARRNNNGVDDGWGLKVVDESEQKEKKQSLFKARRSMETSTSSSSAAMARTELQKPQVMASIIQERTPGASVAPLPQAVEDSRRKKVSRFKAAKSGPATGLATASQDPVTNGTKPAIGIHENTFAPKKTPSPLDDVSSTAAAPPRPLVAPKIIEKPPVVVTATGSSSAAEAKAPSDLDPALHRQEVAMEYFRARNKIIQKEGGFLPREEEEMYVPLEEDRGVKKVSRFKKARVGMGRPADEGAGAAGSGR